MLNRHNCSSQYDYTKQINNKSKRDTAKEHYMNSAASGSSWVQFGQKYVTASFSDVRCDKTQSLVELQQGA